MSNETEHLDCCAMPDNWTVTISGCRPNSLIHFELGNHLFVVATDAEGRGEISSPAPSEIEGAARQLRGATE